MTVTCATCGKMYEAIKHSKCPRCGGIIIKSKKVNSYENNK